MFGLSFSAQLIQGSAVRTWNCVAHFANLLWYKFYHVRHPAMPRSRRRHHSRSRSKSRSRSQSYDRDRDPKRRKLETYDSPHHRRSVSLEPKDVAREPEDIKSLEVPSQNEGAALEASTSQESPMDVTTESINTTDDGVLDASMSSQSNAKTLLNSSHLVITPTKTLSPKQKRLAESEKKKQQKQLEREERERKKQEEKEEKLRLKEEKLKQKLEKEEQKRKEREEKDEQKRKEKEEREQKKREREEKEEAKRKEKELEKLKKQQEIDEKNREKQKIEEQKQKAAAAFVNFFVPKKNENVSEDKKVKNCAFIPFEVKSDMKLAPSSRNTLTCEQKTYLTNVLQKQAPGESYILDLKNGKGVGRSGKTWPYVEPSEEDDDVIVVEDVDLGESILEEKTKAAKLRAKFLKFRENQRPAYYGTWRKRSKNIKPRRPFTEDKRFFDYEVDSDDDWEDEEQGESITGSDEEDKEPEEDNDYEVDNEFFVPHGHLSDDEIDDEKTAKLSPESHKAKLKLLKNAFDVEMKNKTHKLKSRVIGCIWYTKDGGVDDAIDRFLKPFSVISNGQIKIKKRSELEIKVQNKFKELKAELHLDFLELVHGSTKNQKDLINQFVALVASKGDSVDVSKRDLRRLLKKIARWMKCPEKGPMQNKLCWYVGEDTRKKYDAKLQLPNKWNADADV